MQHMVAIPSHILYLKAGFNVSVKRDAWKYFKVNILLIDLSDNTACVKFQNQTTLENMKLKRH